MIFRLRKKRGFSYIEALVIIVIVGLGLVPLINLLMTSFQMNQAGHQYLQANLAIQEMLTLLKNARPEMIREALFSPVDVSLEQIGFSFNEEFLRFEPEADIIIDRYEYDDLFLINVKVNWTERNLKKHASCEYLLSLTNDKFLKVGDL